MKAIASAAMVISLTLGCGADQAPQPTEVRAPSDQRPAEAEPAPQSASKPAPTLPAETMRGPYPTLAAYCKRRAEEARTDGVRNFRCETTPSGTSLAAGRCEEHGCCEYRAAATKKCPRFVLDKPLDNRAGTARAQLVKLWSGSHARCALAVQTGRGWYLTGRARECRTVGVTLGWLELYDLSWFDDHTVVLSSGVQRQDVEPWGMWFCTRYPERTKSGLMTICRVADDSKPSCVHIPSEWKREPMPGMAVVSDCEAGDDIAPSFTSVHWSATIKLVGPLEVDIQTSGDSTGNPRVSPPPRGRHKLPLGE